MIHSYSAIAGAAVGDAAAAANVGDADAGGAWHTMYSNTVGEKSVNGTIFFSSIYFDFSSFKFIS